MSAKNVNKLTQSGKVSLVIPCIVTQINSCTALSPLLSEQTECTFQSSRAAEGLSTPSPEEADSSKSSEIRASRGRIWSSGEFGRPGRRSSVPIPTPNDSGGGYVGWHKGCQKIAFSMRISDMYSNLP